MILTGAGQIGMAVARRMGYGKKIIIGDKSKTSAENITRTMNEAGFDAVSIETDLSSRASILDIINNNKVTYETIHYLPYDGIGGRSHRLCHDRTD